MLGQTHRAPGFYVATARWFAGTTGQSPRQASRESRSSYTMRPGIALNRSKRRASSRMGHQS